MSLLCYWVLFDDQGVWAVARETAGENDDTILFQREVKEQDEPRTAEGLQLEAAYVILEDYKSLDTPREVLEAFADWFFPEEKDRNIMPATIEHWLDVEMGASLEHVTGKVDLVAPFEPCVKFPLITVTMIKKASN